MAGSKQTALGPRPDPARKANRNRILNYVRRTGHISLAWPAVRTLARELRMSESEAESAIDELVFSGQAEVAGGVLRARTEGSITRC